MDAWLWWLLIAGAFAIAEVATTSFVLIMIAGGAGAASISAAVGAPVWLQFIIMAAVSAALIVGVRPIARDHMFQGPIPRSGSDRLVGYRATVLTRTDEHGGRVRLNGGEWSARSDDRSAVYEAGTPVVVVAIDGATAVVVPDLSHPNPGQLDPNETWRAP